MESTDKDRSSDNTNGKNNKDEAPLQMQCKVLENGMIYGDAMHAKGKIMPIEERKARALAAFTPPKVEILGVL